MTPEVYNNLKTAVELGKWPNGDLLNEEQKENSLQLVMAYQSLVLKSEEHFTIGEKGELINKPKRELKAQFAADKESEQHNSEHQIARFDHDDI